MLTIIALIAARLVFVACAWVADRFARAMVGV